MMVDLLSCSKVCHINKCPLTIGKNEISKNSQSVPISSNTTKVRIVPVLPHFELSLSETLQCLNNSILLTSLHKKIHRCEFHDVAGNRGSISFELYNDGGFTELF